MDLIAVAMADTPVPGLPPGVEEAAKRLATDGGVTGALLVLAIAAILGLWWEMRRRDSQASTRLEAVQRAVDAAPAKALEAAGGEAGLAEIVFRKLNLEDDANEHNTLAPVVAQLPRATK
ncbi:hypothetical protein DA075_10345 [Methylobacterium currus]|uniref:Uncharacterized protein n=1 Tax=Methylobacterium currus TaxID=2051553 RepID=A0A2R4WI89_9HYPH|nr:hypothetical protein [Methylobacterium currus]AWB21262.1 hypothetical protein DA075_10345 [Methylobacterium currus]